MNKKQRFIIGITGASGIVYAINFLKHLSNIEGESYIILSDSAKIVLKKEMGLSLTSEEVFLDFCLKDNYNRKHQFYFENNKNIGAKSASGSFLHQGMIVIPCSMKTLSAIAHGYSKNLIERSAEVALKEKRKLILVIRETPYSLIHIQNMKKVALSGGILVPASPGFYHKPKTIEDLLDFISGKVMNLLGIEQKIFPEWKG
ncbi:MAG: UbiX family flavin prenyltransferase [Leptonema sp. (in: bacteria)]